MRMVLISNMPHYEREGVIVGHGPTAREISHMAERFDEIIHLGFLYPGPGPAIMQPYTAHNVRFVPLRATGGTHWASKFGIVFAIPVYLWAITRHIPQGDVVHVRAPGSAPLLAIIALMLLPNPKKRWLKYAGNWRPTRPEARSYALQRLLLNQPWHRGQVTVNGFWDDSKPFVHTFYNPCLTDEEFSAAQQIAADKTLVSPVRLIFVGRVDLDKGVGRVIEILAALRARGVDARLDVAGDGPDDARLATLIDQHEMSAFVTLHGSVPREDLNALYATAHFIVHPSDTSEGWPKVLSEAMAHGAVPLAGDISSIPGYFAHLGAGLAFDPYDIDAFVDAITTYLDNPSKWHEDAQQSARVVEPFTYSCFLDRVEDLLGLSDGHTSTTS